MPELKLYFVGFKKHGEVQYLEAGPFIQIDHAIAKEQELNSPPIHSGGYVVCEAEINAEIVEY